VKHHRPTDHSRMSSHCGCVVAHRHEESNNTDCAQLNSLYSSMLSMKLSTVLMCAGQLKQYTLDLHRLQKYFLSCSLQRCAFTNSLANTFLPIIFCFTKLVSTLYFVCVANG
jgi:hypothetical protein